MTAATDTRTCEVCGRSFLEDWNPDRAWGILCGPCKRDMRDQARRGPCRVCGTQHCTDARRNGNPLRCD